MSNTLPQTSLQSNELGGNDNGNRHDQKSTLAEIERQQSEAMNSAEAAKQKQQTYAAIAQYNSSGAEQEKIQGQNLVQQGGAKQGIGYGMIGMGSAMMAMGMAMMAVPGAGSAMISSGMSTMGQGVQQVVMGGVDISQGQQAMARAQEKLEKATQNNILSKAEAKTVQKEIQRSQMFEMKKAMYESMVEEFKPMLEKMGVNTEDMAEEDLMQWFDKLFEDGAKTFVNGGMLETDLTDTNGNPMFNDENGDPLTGKFYFIEGEDGSFYQVQPVLDEEGNAMMNDNGEPIIDTSKATKVEDQELNAYLEAQFMFADMAESMANELGMSPEEFGQMAMKVNFNDIYSGAVPGPLKVTTEGGEVYLQEWDWANDVPLGPKVPMDEISGGSYDRGDMESYQNALDRSKNALETLGLNAGGSQFNYANSTEELGYTPSGGEASSIDYLLSLDKDSDEFKQFAGIPIEPETENEGELAAEA